MQPSYIQNNHDGFSAQPMVLEDLGRIFCSKADEIEELRRKDWRAKRIRRERENRFRCVLSCSLAPIFILFWIKDDPALLSIIFRPILASIFGKKTEDVAMRIVRPDLAESHLASAGFRVWWLASPWQVRLWRFHPGRSWFIHLKFTPTSFQIHCHQSCQLERDGKGPEQDWNCSYFQLTFLDAARALGGTLLPGLDLADPFVGWWSAAYLNAIGQ